jgi:hypothetical protein
VENLMANKLITTTGFALVTTFAFMSEMAFAQHDDYRPCQKTAKVMFKSCRLDAYEEYKTVLANCINLSGKSERINCRLEAKETLQEDTGFCQEQHNARNDACDILSEIRYDPDPLLDPAIAFINPDEVDDSSANPYVSLVAGHTHVLRAGEDGEETVVVHVTDETREIQGISCRVVADAVVVTERDEEDGHIDYLPVEITDDWFAQDTQSNVYYCGEISRNFEEGTLVDLDGSFESGKESAKAGLLLMAMPQVGLAHRQEFALGEAEDIIEYIDVSAIPNEENEGFPCSDAGGCLMTYDFSPLDPESSEFKYYIPGLGFVLAEAMENGELTGEREELVCTGNSLSILNDPACDIEDPEKLLEELCKLAPDAFCD